MKDTHQLLSFWLEKWKRQVEKPRELIFARSFVNTARAAAFSLEKDYRAVPPKKIQRSATSWGRKLLELLEEAYGAKDPAIELLKLEHQTEVDELERQLKMPELDLAVIFPLLEKLKEGLSLPVISKALTGEIQLDESADTTRIGRLTTFLLKIILTKHDSLSLKRFPQKSLAQHGSEFFLSLHLEALASDKQLASELWKAMFDFWREETSAEKIEAALKKHPESLLDVFDTYLWGNLARVDEKNCPRILQRIEISYFLFY